MNLGNGTTTATTTKKRPAAASHTATKKHSTNGGGGAKSAYEKVGTALASTASFAASVAKGTIRDLAAVVAPHHDTDAAPRATDLLVSHHRKVEKLLEQLESSKGDRDTLMRELADDLTAHIAIEEELFYPAVRKLNPDLILEGLEEHAMGRFALKRLLGTHTSDQSLKARLKALQELMINHHKEEERELFPKVRKAMSDDAARKLGKAMKALFDSDVARGHEAVLATFHDEPGRPIRARSTGKTSSKKAPVAKKTAGTKNGKR